MFELQKIYIPSKKRSAKTMALPLRLVTTSVLLIFFVLAVWLLNSHHSLHAGGNILADENNRFLTQETGLGENTVGATAARDNRPKARKMMVENVANKAKMTMMMSEKRNIAAAASEKCGSSKMSKLARKEEVDWSEEGQKRSLLSKEINVGFVAFNEDYHGPRHHPPKNN